MNTALVSKSAVQQRLTEKSSAATAGHNRQFNALIARHCMTPAVHSSQSELNINIKNGVATLSGKSGSTAGANMVEDLVSKITGVNHVINLITSDAKETAG